MLHSVTFLRDIFQVNRTAASPHPEGPSTSERFPVPLLQSLHNRVFDFFKKLCPPATAQQTPETLWLEATILDERH